MTSNNCFGHNNCNNPIVFTPDCCKIHSQFLLLGTIKSINYFTKLISISYFSIFANPSDANRVALFNLFNQF